MGYSEALTAALLNTLRPPTIRSTAPGTVSVSEGQLIRATIQQVNDQTVLLNVAGQLISAKTDIPLEPRQQVLLNVRQAGPDQIILQIIPDTGAQEQPAAATAQSGNTALDAAVGQNIRQTLASWGMPADAVNVQLAEALLTHGRTLNPQDLQAARQAWVNLPNPTPADLDAVAFLQANKLPLSPESVSLAKQWLSGLPPIANQLNELQQTLSAVLSRMPPAANASPALNQLTQVLQSTLSQIAQWNITADTPPAEIAARLESLVVNLSSPPEASLAKQPEVRIVLPQSSAPATQNAATNAAPNTPATPPSAPPQTTTAPTATANTAPPSAAPETSSAPAPAPAAPPAAAQNTAPASATPPTVTLTADVQVDNPLHRLARTISGALASGNLPPAQTDALQQLARQVQQLTQDLGAVQLSNLAQTLSTETGQFYLFPVPLRHADGSQTTAKLKIFRQAGRTKMNPENTRLALLLDLPSLGEIAIDLTVFKRQISGRVLTGQPETNKLVAENIDDLEARLKSIGYRVEMLSTAMLSDAEPDSPVAEPDNRAKLTQIDVSI